MSRRLDVLTADGQGRTKPIAVHAKVLRAKGWWFRRCLGLDLDVVRLPAVPS